MYREIQFINAIYLTNSLLKLFKNYHDQLQLTLTYTYRYFCNEGFLHYLIMRYRFFECLLVKTHFFVEWHLGTRVYDDDTERE